MTPFTKNSTWKTNRNALKLLPRKQIILFACDIVRLVLPIFEQQCPEDKRPRTVIETTELFLYGQATKDQVENAFVASNATPNVISNVISNATFCSACVACAACVAYAAFNVVYSGYYAVDAAYDAASHPALANSQIQQVVQTIYKQTTKITIPTTPILKAIANQIRITRNFQEYNILLDNLEECHNIRLERTIPLGLSHYVLYHLTNTH